MENPGDFRSRSVCRGVISLIHTAQRLIFSKRFELKRCFQEIHILKGCRATEDPEENHGTLFTTATSKCVIF